MINKERLLSSFLEYVKIDSESRHEKNMAQFLKKELEDLGFKASIDSSMDKTGSDTGNVIAFLEGDPLSEPLLFSCHMDTVIPGKNVEPIVKDGFVYSNGSTILGSDDKSGIAEIIEAIKSAKEQNIKTIPIEICFSVCEEIGLLGAKAVDFSSFRSKKALVFDCGGDAGTMLKAAPGQVSFTADFIGKASHAGTAPENGISAIMAAAGAISNMELLRIDEETTANISTFESSFPTNIVPDKAHIAGEVRSRNIDKLNINVKKIKEAIDDACKRFGASAETEFKTMYEPYSHSEDFYLIEKVKSACEKLSIVPKVRNGGGGSDANIMNRQGIDAIVVSSGMANVHTKGEFIKIKDMQDTAEMILELIKA